VLLKTYFSNQTNADMFSNSILVFFGFLKGEDKKFRPTNIDDNMEKLLDYCCKNNLIPSKIKETVKSFLRVRQTASDNQKALERCLI
jgi:hypothetical protein